MSRKGLLMHFKCLVNLQICIAHLGRPQKSRICQYIPVEKIKMALVI